MGWNNDLFAQGTTDVELYLSLEPDQRKPKADDSIECISELNPEPVSTNSHKREPSPMVEIIEKPEKKRKGEIIFSF